VLLPLPPLLVASAICDSVGIPITGYPYRHYLGGEEERRDHRRLAFLVGSLAVGSRVVRAIEYRCA
jgi:hypothetical protein